MIARSSVKSLAIVLAAAALSGCLVTEASEPQTWSVTVETSDTDRHGVLYDYDRNMSVAVGLVFINGIPVSYYPDLHLMVVSESGVGDVDANALTSDCEDNLLKCELMIDAPRGYFALLLIDLDAKTIDKHDFVDALIFTDHARGPIDPARVAAVEQHARAWMEGAVEGVPRRAFSVVRRDECREEACAADGLSGTASFAIMPMERMPGSTTDGPSDPSTESDQQAQ